MPFPNEHSCRLVDPGKCRDGSFRRENQAKESNGKKIDVIYAERKSDRQTVEQAYRYPTGTWSEADARQHCQDNEGLRFEPASENSSAMPEIHGKSWAITEQGFDGLMSQIESLDKSALMTKSGEEMRDSSNTVLRGRVAVIEIVGPIFHYRNILTEIIGFPAAEALAHDVQAAVDNYQVDSILLRIDSPGGQVGGINELAGIIQQANKEKPVQAYIADMGASAAYWIASAASYISVDATAELGSIGVVFGLRRRPDNSLEIVNSESPQKRPDINTEEGVELIRQRANELAEVFIQAVASNRNLSRDQVVALQGGLRVGQSAIKAGLADEINSLEGVISRLQNLNGGIDMDLQTLKQNHADLYEQVKKEGKDEASQDLEQAREQAKKEGREEAQKEILEQSKAIWGQENAQLLEQVVQSGLTAEQLKNAQQLFAKTGGGQGSGKSGEQNEGQQILDGLQNAHGHTGLQPDQSLEQSQNALVENAKQRAGNNN